MSNIIDRVKLPFQKNSQLRKALYNILGKYPHNLDLYREALAHRSQQYRGRNGQEKPVNNERLEFLGDAVLEATVSHIVFNHFPSKREGFLTNTRSKLVQRETLNRLAARMGIIDLIHANVNTPSHNSNVGGNAFEALVGALYLDHGYQAALSFVQKKMMDSRTLNLDDTAQKETNFKSKLLEWAQKNKLQCDFRVDDEITRDGNSEFHTSVVIEGIVCGEGKGFSKKQAEQETARNALTRLRHEEGFKERVFGGKEQRTAMEAEEYAALPRIAEIDHTSNAGMVPATGKKKPVRHRENARPKTENASRQKPENTPQGKTENEAKPKPAKEVEVQNNNEGKPEKSPAKTNTPNNNRRPSNKSQRPAEKPTEGNSETKAKGNKPERKAADTPSSPAEKAKKPAETPVEKPVEKPVTESSSVTETPEQPAGAVKKKRPTRRHRPAKRAPGVGNTTENA